MATQPSDNQPVQNKMADLVAQRLKRTGSICMTNATIVRRNFRAGCRGETRRGRWGHRTAHHCGQRGACNVATACKSGSQGERHKKITVNTKSCTNKSLQINQCLLQRKANQNKLIKVFRKVFCAVQVVPTTRQCSYVEPVSARQQYHTHMRSLINLH